MGVELVRKHITIALRSCYRSASRHPLLVFMVFVLIWIYRWFPVMFSLLVYASPVIASTLVLLGTLLLYGHANAPEIQKEGKPHHHEIHNLEIGVMGNTEITEETYFVNNKEAKSDLGNQKLLFVNRHAQFYPFETDNTILKSPDRSRRNSIDPSRYEDNKGWETGPDRVESSSASTLMAEIFPMLDELHPLLESDVPHPNVSTDAASDHSFESGEIVNETDDDDDDDDQEDITWTEDDQRNLMNLGTSELERNQRLENLIARQKALKNMRMLAEKNMVNISPELYFNPTQISNARKNPFDLPYYSNQNIHGYAPTVMIQRNPFDLSYDPRGQKPNRAGPAFQSDSVPLQTINPLGRCQESFDVGPSTLGLHSDPESIASTHTSDISEHIIQRSRFSEDDDTMKLHHVAEGNDRINAVKISCGNTGYEEKTSNKSSSSSFFYVTDVIYDGVDDDNEEEEYSSIDNSMTHDSKDLQIGDFSVDYSATQENGGLPQRLKSWLTGWKA